MTEAVKIEPVKPGTEAEKEFLQLPFTVYKDNPHFVPWFNRSIKKIIAKNHPFFEHSEGEFFIARREEETVGRIALLEPKKFNDYQHKKDARFYFLETKDDLGAARELFTFAEEWAMKRGLDRLIGPQGFSGFTGAGVLIDGFDQTASMTMMSYHLPYYRELLESVGFEKYKDFYSAEIDAKKQILPQKYKTFAELAKKRGRFSVPELSTKQELQAVAREVGRLYNESWEDHEEFCPMTEAEMNRLMEELLEVTEPSLVKVIRREEELAGFVLAFPDLSAALKRANGKVNPLILRNLMKEKQKATKYLINGLGILPQYQKNGGIAILFNEMAKTLREHEVSTAEMTQIAETTDLMLSNIKKMGARIYKTHRVYQKKL
jgi:hypothetical protein